MLQTDLRCAVSRKFYRVIDKGKKAQYVYLKWET